MPGIDEIVQITASISQGASVSAEFGGVFIVTTDDRISLDDRVKVYDSLSDVARAFPDGNVLERARRYFGQVPTPPPLTIARWYKTGQSSILRGGTHRILAAIQALGNTWSLNVNGNMIAPAILGGNVVGMNIVNGGSGYSIAPAIAFSGGGGGSGAVATAVVTAGVITSINITNPGSGYTTAPTITVTGGGTGASITAVIGPGTLAAVATGVQASIQAVTDLSGALVVYDTGNSQFVLTLRTGQVFTVTPTGTLALALGLATGTIVNGHAAETRDAGMADIDAQTDAYWLNLADDINVVEDVIGFAEWAAATTEKKMIWDETDAGSLATNELTSVAGQLSLLNSVDVAWIYGSRNDYKSIGAAGFFAAIDFEALNSLKNLHGKPIVGSAGDNLSSAQVTEVARKFGNYYQRRGTGGYVVNGWAVNGVFLDLGYWYDWLVHAMRASVFNLLASPTVVVPQTNAGLALIEGAVRGACDRGYQNGGLDGGRFSEPVSAAIRRVTGNTGFNGFTARGYYIYIPTIDQQLQEDRAARKSPPISVWLKARGAIQNAAITLLLEP